MKQQRFGHVFCMAQDVATRQPIMVTELFTTFRDCNKRANEIARELKTIAHSKAKTANELHFLTVG